jgi:hypothetical protein
MQQVCCGVGVGVGSAVGQYCNGPAAGYAGLALLLWVLLMAAVAV